MIETVGPGGAVGWSWLFPPYRWHFDARALDPVGAVAVDAACLRAKADADPALGLRADHPGRRASCSSGCRRPGSAFSISTEATVPAEVAARHRRLPPGAGADRAGPPPGGRAPRGDRRRHHAVARAAVRRAAGVRAGSVQHAHGLRRRRGGHLESSSSRREPGTLHTRPRRRAGDPRPLPGRAGRRRGGARARSAPLGRARRAATCDTGDVVVVAGGIGLAPLRGAVDELWPTARPDGGRVFVVVGAREPDQVIFADDLEAWDACRRARGGDGRCRADRVGRPRRPGHLAARRYRLRPDGRPPR